LQLAATIVVATMSRTRSFGLLDMMNEDVKSSPAASDRYGKGIYVDKVSREQRKFGKISWLS